MECPKCGNKSMIRKCYNRKIDGVFKKVDICFHVGCGYVKDHTARVPSIAEVRANKGVEQGQKEFSF